MTLQELDQLRDTNVETINRATLTNIEDVQMDCSMPAVQRMLKYLDEVKNPYCFLCGETPVKICFSADGETLANTVKRYFLQLKE